MFYAFMHKKSSKFSTALHLFSLELRLLRTSLHQPKKMKNEKIKSLRGHQARDLHLRVCVPFILPDYKTLDFSSGAQHCVFTVWT